MITVRYARPADLPDVVDLCAQHARYERAPFDASGLARRLQAALRSTVPTLRLWVADEGSRVCGYASATIDFSTWTGRAYLHMDCLYVEQVFRGRGIGRRLMAAVLAAAREGEFAEVQWQTPGWNGDAIRFYERWGARSANKVRFSLPVSRVSDPAQTDGSNPPDAGT